MSNKSSGIVSLILNFLPGLILGVVCGGLLAAFMTPIAESWANRQPDPTHTSVRLANR
ncbi:MAG TPA: hypothetical protein VD997_06640 [Phycisphaerales bacterium]|nr:hypothetical protein [Phycisphaerales bacterium]